MSVKFSNKENQIQFKSTKIAICEHYTAVYGAMHQFNQLQSI